MPEFLKHLLSGDGFMPHGHGCPWRSPLVSLHILSDDAAHDLRAPLRATSGDSATFLEHHATTLGGRVCAKGAEARGTTVLFTLPLGARQPPTPRAHTP